jgi:hypothetical protein
LLSHCNLYIAIYKEEKEEKKKKNCYDIKICSHIESKSKEEKEEKKKKKKKNGYDIKICSHIVTCNTYQLTLI